MTSIGFPMLTSSLLKKSFLVLEILTQRDAIVRRERVDIAVLRKQALNPTGNLGHHRLTTGKDA